MAKIGFIMLLFLVFTSFAEEAFDVRQRLSTVTRYEVSKGIKDNTFESSNIPDQCSPIHLNLVARHGTRYPTDTRINELEGFSAQLKVLLRNAKDKGLSLEKIPSWLWGWSYPWKWEIKGGELTSDGEDEMYRLGNRIGEGFQELFRDEYHPDIYRIRATEIPRVSASAVAFSMGMFSGRGKLGEGRHRAFVVVSENRTSDIVLRFHDCCHNYKAYKKQKEPDIYELKEPILDEIARSLAARYELNFTVNDTSTLWFLCKQEASLLNITDQACGLFSKDEVELLEWTDDVEMFILKGYGNSINYQMGVPLLYDVIKSMEAAIEAKEGFAPGSGEKARLRFAHAETLVPFSCLIGLFLEGSEFEQIQREEGLTIPPKPPLKRNWRGSMVAPFAGNIVLVLYSCPANDTSKYFVQVLHNEQPMPMAGCGGKDFCPYKVFKKNITDAHLKHNYDNICKAQMEEQSGSMERSSWTFSGKNEDKASAKEEL